MMRALVAFAVMAPASTLAQPARGDIHVIVTGFDNTAGHALIAVFRTSAGFPEEGQRAAATVRARIDRDRVEVWFRNLPAGPFAIAVLHDEDDDTAMDTGLFGIPTEDYGVSRNATRDFGPPVFEDCVIDLRPGSVIDVRIEVD